MALPDEEKPVFFRWMVIQPLGEASVGPFSPLQGRESAYASFSEQQQVMVQNLLLRKPRRKPPSTCLREGGTARGEPS